MTSYCARFLGFGAFHHLWLVRQLVTGNDLLIMIYGASSGSFLLPLPPRPLLPEGDGGAHLDVLGGGATTAAILEDDLATHWGLFLFIVIGGI
jgi:hypothetical protein